MKRIVLDTNWWISFIISNNANGIPSFFFEKLIFCFSAELSIEIRSVLQYPRIAKRINNSNLQAFTFFEQNIAQFFSVLNDVKVCRDSKDNFLSSLARDANADFLISRDQDLLVLKKYKNTQIINLSKFVELYK